jgi:hypothetical protein
VNLNDYPNNEVLMAVINAIDETKVDKVEGKGLSTNDYTTEDKEKVAKISDETEDTQLVSFVEYTEDEIQALWDSVIV